VPNYWVVGATIGGVDQHEVFVRRGYWLMVNEKPEETARRVQIAPGDRIAIKRMLGQGSASIEVRAIGIVTESDHADARVYVNWVASGLQRQVPARGCFATIHGPFPADDDWVRLAFQL
jgi:hypothetical protein